MIVLDENITEDQRLLLRSWRIRAYQVGRDVGRAGIKDEQIIPMRVSQVGMRVFQPGGQEEMLTWEP
jgi:hypothetical protein